MTNEQRFKAALEQITDYVESVDPVHFNESESWSIATRALQEAGLDEMAALTQEQYRDSDNPLTK